jgi:hypothetical protein
MIAVKAGKYSSTTRAHELTEIPLHIDFLRKGRSDCAFAHVKP